MFPISKTATWRSGCLARAFPSLPSITIIIPEKQVIRSCAWNFMERPLNPRKFSTQTRWWETGLSNCTPPTRGHAQQQPTEARQDVRRAGAQRPSDKVEKVNSSQFTAPVLSTTNSSSTANPRTHGSGRAAVESSSPCLFETAPRSEEIFGSGNHRIVEFQIKNEIAMPPSFIVNQLTLISQCQ